MRRILSTLLTWSCLLSLLLPSVSGTKCYNCAIFDVIDECSGFGDKTPTRECPGECAKISFTLKTDLGKAKGEDHKCSHDLLHPGSMSDPCKGNEDSCFHWDSSTFNGEKIEKVKVCCCSGDLCNSSSSLGGSLALTALLLLFTL